MRTETNMYLKWGVETEGRVESKKGTRQVRRVAKRRVSGKGIYRKGRGSEGKQRTKYKQKGEAQNLSKRGL